jgi:hypothetical protein
MLAKANRKSAFRAFSVCPGGFRRKSFLLIAKKRTEFAQNFAPPHAKTCPADTEIC